MSGIGVVVREILGLFVDDWPFTLVVIGWLLVADLVLPPLLPAGGAWDGPVLFLGCALILALSSRWTARRHRSAGERRPGRGDAG